MIVKHIILTLSGQFATLPMISTYTRRAVSPEQLLSLGLSKELVVIIVAALPILELRGAIPIAINLFDLPWYYAFLLAFVGNLLPIPLLLLFLSSIIRALSRIGFLKHWLNWFFNYTRQRSKIVERYKRIGLMLFVAIPLPVTGAWTGSLVSVLSGLNFKYSIISISLGVFVAGVIVTCLSLLGWIGALLAGIGLCVFIAFSLWKT